MEKDGEINLKIQKNIVNFINISLFILMYAFRSFTDAIYVSKGIESNFLINVKYLILGVAILFGIFQLKYKKEKTIYNKELLNVFIVIMIIIFISLIMIIISGNFYFSFIEKIIKLILPITYVYLILNIMKFEDIYKCMCGALILSFLGYILEIGINNFTISNFLKIDFIHSYSPFESHYSAGTAIAMCTFFMYYRKNKIFKYLSLIFAILTFKRMAVIFAPLLLFLPKFIDVNKDLKIKYKNIIKIIFIVLTLVYLWLLTPQSSLIFEKIFGENQTSMTMGRSDFLQSLMNMNFVSSGYGSISNTLGRGLEMDLISIFLETTIIGLVVFVNGYWNCAGNKVYTYIYMMFQFLNLLTSHSLSNSFNWILAFLIIGCITYKKEEKFKIKRLSFCINRRINGTDKSVDSYTNI